MKLSEYISLDGVDIVNLIQKKEVTKKEILDLSFEQLDKVNHALNAITNIRRETVYEEIKNNSANGKFDGMPLFLKDISKSLKGELLTSGSRLFTNHIATSTSNFVQKLLSEGCLPMGHTTTPEFALKNVTEPEIHGATRNPWNHDYAPGGSSGGAAALVAAGVVPITGASDGGGSIRIPASFTGLFGLKPTRGRTPVGPGVGRNWQGAAVEFVLSKSVRDSARMLDVLQVVQQQAAFQTPLFPGVYEDVAKKPFEHPLTIGFTLDSPVGTPVAEDAKEAVKKVLYWLEAEGHHIEEVDNGVDGIQLMRHYYLMNSGEISSLVHELEELMQKEITADDMEIEAWVLHVAGKNVSAAEFSRSLASWDVAAEKMAVFHETYDFYITPATAFAAPKIGELTATESDENMLRENIAQLEPSKQQELIYDMFLPGLTYTPFTQLANLTGQPAMSVPVHMTKSGLPIGVQAVAAKGLEHRLLQLAHQLEQTDLWVGMQGNPYFN